MRVLRALAMTTTVLWAAFWLPGSMLTVFDPLEGMNTVDTVASAVFTAMIGLAPGVPYWTWEYLRFRRRRRAALAEAAEAHQRRLRADQASIEAQRRAGLELLPEAMRGEWQRLEDARDLVKGFAAEGWIEPDAVREVDGHVERLRALLEADARTARLGGTSSPTLFARAAGLTSLLVALADSAVDHQATLMSDDPVPVTLAEARDRLSNTSIAYRDLQQPG